MNRIIESAPDYRLSIRSLKSELLVAALLVSILAMLGFSGCTIHHNVSENLNIENPSAAKIPLRAGLYVSSEMKNLEAPQPNKVHRIHVGEGLARGAEKAYRATFDEVLIIDDSVTDMARLDIDVIASGLVTKAHWIDISSRRVCTTTIKWTIADKKGDDLYVNTITGEGTTKHFTKAIFEKCFTASIEDHYNKLVRHLTSVNWWQSLKKE
ncbi:MAG: hypothetical protein M1377_08550 [Deltaproteobacteria bacterium]|nr:hypothetical protein [Deltaproteobacteria bacterium]